VDNFLTFFIESFMLFAAYLVHPRPHQNLLCSVGWNVLVLVGVNNIVLALCAKKNVPGVFDSWGIAIYGGFFVYMKV
jgi:hypothetical protein